MKFLSKFFAFMAIVSFGLFAFTPSNGLTKSEKIKVEKVVKVKQLVAKLNVLKTNQFDMCDTCVASFTSTVIESRLLSERLHDEIDVSHDLIETVQAKKFALNQQIVVLSNMTAVLEKERQRSASLYLQVKRRNDATQAMLDVNLLQPPNVKQ